MNDIRLSDRGVPQGSIQTQAIQALLDEASRMGGATVVIPRGTYLAGTLNLGSASLYLEKGAVLKASPNPEDYRDNGFVHNEMRKTICFLYSMDAEGISICGNGTIDLSGDSFYEMSEANVPDYGVPFSEEQRAECTRPISWRPTQPIFFHNCRDLTISGIHIRNAPCWTMAFHACEEICVRDLTIQNSLIIPNNDGMHFCGCRNILIRGCSISAGDDCIALSGITDWNRPCENVVISDCILRSVSKAISIGYMHSIIRNVCISNCVIYDSQRGLCIMSSKGTGLVEHVTVQNLWIDTHVRAGNWWGNGEVIEILGLYHNYEGYLDPAPEARYRVNVRDIRVHNLSCSGENVIAVIGDGNIENVSIAGVFFEKKPSANRYLKGENRIDVSPSAEDVRLPEDGEYWLYAVGCKDLQTSDVILRDYEGQKLKAYIR